MGDKCFHVNLLLEVCPQTLCPRVAVTRFVHAQVDATDEKFFLRNHPGGLSRKERKSESAHPLCYNRWNRTTYENVLSVAINDLSHWDVLACEAHQSRAPNELGLILCAVALRLAIRCMAPTGHRGLRRKNCSPSLVRALTSTL